MGHHLFLGPVDDLAETVEVLEIGHVADGGQGLTLVVVLDELELGLAGFRVFAHVLALLDDHDIQILILAAAQRQLNVALVAQHECGGSGFRANHVAAAVILGLLLERNEVILTQLRGRAEVEAFAQQRTGKDRAGIAFLQGGVDGNSAGDRGGKAAGSGRVAQRAGDKVLIHFGVDGNAEFLFLRCAVKRLRHTAYLPFP